MKGYGSAETAVNEPHRDLSILARPLAADGIYGLAGVTNGTGHRWPAIPQRDGRPLAWLTPRRKRWALRWRSSQASEGAATDAESTAATWLTRFAHSVTLGHQHLVGTRRTAPG
jgi:hypothetical protein